MDKVKLGFIGAGNIVKAHLNEGLKDFPDVEFVGWCDINEKAGLALKEFCGGKGAVFTDPEQMIKEAKPDALFIMLPPFAHGKAEETALKHKLPFFIEKPVALDYSFAEKIANKVQKLGLTTSVGYMTRYRASVNKVKELFQTQKPVLLQGGWLLGMWDGSDGWWVRKHLSGGQFLEQATHAVDLARYLFGDVKSVYAVAQKGVMDVRPAYFTIEDSMMAQLVFKNGAVGNIYSSVIPRVGGGVSMTAYGLELCAKFTGSECNVVIELPENKKIEMTSNDKALALETRAFINAVKNGDKSGIKSDYLDGLKTLQVTVAANKSAATGKAISF
jgi:myo-inositol 2-dehydrogenase / D-chiro-inositol 1-dehydrogenase